MKKILLFIVALVATLSMNAQTTEIYKDTTLQKAYYGADVTVSFGENSITVKQGEVEDSYKGSDYKVVSKELPPVSVTFVNPEGDVISTMPATQSIQNGSKATKPSNPTDKTPGNSGFHTLEGWYKTKDATTGELSDKWDFNNVVTEDITLYAQWQTTIEKIIGKAASGADKFPFASNKDNELTSCTYVKDDKTWTAPDDDNVTNKMFFGLWLYDSNTGGYTAKGIGVRVTRKTNGKPRTSSTFYSRNVLKTKDTYKYKGNLGTFTFTIENGVFNKLEFEGTSPDDALCNGTYTPPTTTGTAKARINGMDVDVKWIQLWKNGPKFAEYNVGVTDGKAASYVGLYCWGGTNNNDSKPSWNGYYTPGSSELSHTGNDITDTATNLWGSNWRMPTKDELQALIDSCDVAWTTVGGKNGRKFTGKGVYSSNSVFLPAAGRSCSTGVDTPGYDGQYWSSTPDASDSEKAYTLDFSSSYLGMYKWYRRYGESVRAVLAK